MSVAFAPDGRSLASGGADKVVRLWTLDGQGGARETARLEGHGGVVWCVAFAPDGRSLASGGIAGIFCYEVGIGTLPERQWHWDGGDLMFLGSDRVKDWVLRRTDGRAFKTVERGGAVLPADEALYDRLWFWDPDWGLVPAFEVPPGWLRWSDDRRTLTVSKERHSPRELEAWIAETEAASPH